MIPSLLIGPELSRIIPDAIVNVSPELIVIPSIAHVSGAVQNPPATNSQEVLSNIVVDGSSRIRS